MIFGGKRACGKTTELIKISGMNNIPIVVLNNDRKNNLVFLSKRIGIEIPKPIIAKNYQSETRGRDVNEILIDDIEDILSNIFFPARIVAMTSSIPFKPLEQINRSGNNKVHHVVAPIEKLKELILENHKGYMNLRLKEKIVIVKHFAIFENDTDLLDFLKYMEEDEK